VDRLFWGKNLRPVIVAVHVAPVKLRVDPAPLGVHFQGTRSLGVPVGATDEVLGVEKYFDPHLVFPLV